MKKIISVIVATIMLFFLFLPSTVFAASNVTFEGDSDKFVILPENKDLFENFKNILPGETRTQNILLQNTSARKLDFYFKIEKHSALGDGLDDLRDELISLLVFNIDYGNGQSSTQKFNDIVDDSNWPQTDKVKDGYVYLATLNGGESLNIDLSLYAPGDLIDNRFKNLDLYVDWYFYVEDRDSDTGYFGDLFKYPQTGGYIAALLGVGILGIGIAVIKISKRKGYDD